MSKVLVLDAGHGLYTRGKETMNGSVGVVKEWTLNNAVCTNIQKILDEYDVKIYRTDDITGKNDVSLSSRVSQTNAYKPDLFISIHHNAGGGTGTEVYYHTYGTNADKQVASMIAPKLAQNLNCRNRGVKYAQFAVLTCSATAVLVEGGFMDTVSDYNVIVTSSGQLAYAQAVADAVIDYLKLTKITTSSQTSTSNTTQTRTFKIGDRVKITGSKYATGQTIPAWVKASTYEITRVSGSKALLSNIISWVNFSDLTLVSSESSDFLVRIITPVLNIRAQASLNAKIVGTVKEGEVFTIVEESNGFGKLKSGAGWISLGSRYASRV